MPNSLTRPIGIFDSGVGGLSVLKSIRQELPHQDIIYFADQAHVPYGSRPVEEVRNFSDSISRFLLQQGCPLIVVACNTASAASLKDLRQTFPDVPFVGMVPAVKPAAEQTLTGIVGVLATPSTFQSELYASVVERFANGVEILQDTCPGLVGLVEEGNLTGFQTRNILEQAIKPMLARGIDTIVLGCTHYPFVIPLIQEIAGENVRVIDPAPAVARQTIRMMESHHIEPSTTKKGFIQCFTSGEPGKIIRFVDDFCKTYCTVEKLTWKGNSLSP